MSAWIRRRRTLARLDRLTHVAPPAERLRLTRTHALVLGFVVLLCLSSRPVYAMPMSCFTEYQQFTTQAWNTYDQCIRDTNDDPWGAKLLIRQGCRLEWISNAMQAEGAYVSCMANFSALWR